MRLNMLLAAVGVVAFGAGVYLEPAAGLVGLGSALLVVGLLREDGTAG